MSRVIKFRAWDKRTNRMFYSDDNQTVWAGGDEISVNSTNGKISGDFVGMQFTGLLDKNGKEIFEGDIVKFEWSTPTTGGYLQSDDMYSDHEIISACTYKYLSFGFDSKEGKRVQFSKYWHKEVIGNIYENPELL